MVLFFLIISFHFSIEATPNWSNSEIYKYCRGWNSRVVGGAHICHEYKIVFLHIYKVGGTSLGEFIKSICSNSYFGNFLPNHPFLRINEIIELSNQNYFIFTLIRDPIERFLSAYHELGIRNQTNFNSSLSILENFASFINHTKVLFEEGSKTLDGHLVPQSCCVRWESSRLPIDMVLRLSHMSIVPNIIQEISGLKDLSLPKERNRKSKKYTNPLFYITKKDLNSFQILTLCRLYDSDFIMFGFLKPKICNL